MMTCSTSFTRTILAGLVLFALLGAGYTVYAQENTTPTDVIVLAQVSVSDASVVQNDTALMATFTLSNAADTLQPDIRYGLELWSTSADQSKPSVRTFVAVADETFALPAHSSLPKTLSVTAPDTLSGLYRVRIVAETTSGLPLGSTTAGTVHLSGEGIVIDQGSCKALIEGEDVTYTTSQGADMTEEETLLLSCAVSNPGETIALTPQFVTTLRSLYGEKMETTTGESVTIPAGESTLTVTIPTPSAPQAYDTAVTLFEGATPLSNTAYLHYVIQGASATIQHITLDKTTYQEGDTATATLFLTGIAGNFPGARTESKTLKNPVLIATLHSQSDIACAEEVVTPLADLEDTDAAFADIIFSVTRTCPNATVSLEVKDDSGTLAAHTAVTDTPDSTTLSFAALIVLILVAGVVVYLVSRAGRSVPAAFILIGVGGLLVFGGSAEAYNYKSVEENIKVTGTSFTAVFKKIVLSNTDAAVFTVQGSIDRKEYNPGENMLVDVNVRSSVCNNTSFEVGMSWGIDEGELRRLFTQEVDNSNASGYGCFNLTGEWCNIHETAAFDEHLVPGPGEHDARFAITGFALHEETGYTETIIGNILVPFTVIAPPDPTVSLSAQPNIVFEGDDTVLTWTPVNVSSCVAKSNPPVSGWEGSITANTQDSMIVGPLALVDPSVYLFSISCIDGEGEIVEDFVQVFVEEKVLPECSDGADNDGDQWTDEEDPGCNEGGVYDPNDDDESDTAGDCSDGVDNDDDNQIDGFDPGCSSGYDNTETGEPTEPNDDGDDDNPNPDNPGDPDMEDGGPTDPSDDNPDDIDFSEF